MVHPSLSASLFSPGGCAVFLRGVPADPGDIGIVDRLGVEVFSSYQEVLPWPDGRPPEPSSKSPPLVGRITGMVDCRWADPTTKASDRDGVPLGRKYALASGFMEITYDTGAKVILQGPCHV